MAESILDKITRHLVSRLFSRRIFQRMNTAALRFALLGLGVHNRLGGDPTRNERNFLKRLRTRLGDRPVILDVGANVGQYAIAARELMPDAEIYSFEPNPVSYRILENAAGRIGVKTVNVACSDTNATTILYDFDDKRGSASASLHKKIIDFTGHKAYEHEVTCVRLDDFLADNKVMHVDFLKIDTEGHDLKVIEGARRFLDESKIDLIQFEFARINSAAHVLMKDFHDALPGFVFYRLAANGDLLPLGNYEPITWELFGHQNIIAMREGATPP
jgi:FkbM family methyltransferase